MPSQSHARGLAMGSARAYFPNAAQARTYLAAGQPVVRVDAKNKESVGRFADGGRDWQPSGELDQVRLPAAGLEHDTDPT